MIVDLRGFHKETDGDTASENIRAVFLLHWSVVLFILLLEEEEEIRWSPEGRRRSVELSFTPQDNKSNLVSRPQRLWFTSNLTNWKARLCVCPVPQRWPLTPAGGRWVSKRENPPNELGSSRAANDCKWVLYSQISYETLQWQPNTVQNSKSTNSTTATNHSSKVRGHQDKENGPPHTPACFQLFNQILNQYRYIVCSHMYIMLS